MLKINNLKKVLSCILIILTVLNITYPIFAISGTGSWVGGEYASKILTTETNANGILIRKLVNNQTGQKMTVFCAEHGVNFDTGVTVSGQYYTPTDENLKEACKVAYFGWYSVHPSYVVDGGILSSSFLSVKKTYVFTQQLIWEKLGQTNSTFLDSDIQNEYKLFKDDINKKITDMKMRPSFNNNTVQIQAGETIIIDDTNGVLKDYNSIDKTADGIKFVHNKGENFITITVDKNCTMQDYKITNEMTKEWGLIKDKTEDKDTTVYFSFKEGMQNQLYAMNYNDPVSLSMKLQINSFGRLELTKLDKIGNLIDGAIFQITGADNYNQEVTVSNGKIVVEGLKSGIYTINEKKAPNGYLLDTQTYQVEIKVNETTAQAIVNEEPTGTFTLIKKNEDSTANIPNTRYRIWNNSGYNQEFITDGNGRIEVTGLKLGQYKYQEIQASEGYLIDTTIYEFELNYIDQYTEVVYSNAEKTNVEPTGTITIIKQDSETGNKPQGDATFENAVYEIYAKEDIYNKSKTKKYYSNGDLVKTCIMTAEGTTEQIKNLPLGKYVVKESISSLGYLLDKNEYDVNLEYIDQNTPIVSKEIRSYEVVKKMQLHIFKSGMKENSGIVNGIEGVDFDIKLNSDVQKALEQGYTYEEIWNGIDIYGNKVTVDKDRINQAQLIAPTYEIIKTDTDGNAYTKNKLPYGKYIVKEIYTPEDYETAVDFTFSITEDESEIEEIAKKVKHLVVNNEPLETYIKIVKKDFDTNETVTLNSATFEIKAIEDIYDGKLIYKKGDTITQKVGSTVYSTFTTNADNIVVPDNNSYNNQNDEKGTSTTPLRLLRGSYEINEIRVPNGYLQLEKPVVFTIDKIRDYDIDKQGSYIKEVIVKNEKPKGILKLNKKVTLRENIDKTMIKDIDFTKISFELVADENIINCADGSIIYEKGKVVGKYNLKTDGTLTVIDLPMGKYHLKELATIDGAVLDETKYEVFFEQKDTITKEYIVEESIENKTTVVEISKTDITGEKELVGAKLTITDENNEIIDSWVSTEKTHKIEGLVVGKEYILKEEIAPNGFVVATEIKFRVENITELQKVTMIDKVVEISKQDIGGNEIEGAELKVIDKDNNIIDEWTSTKEPHKIKNLVEGKTYTIIEEYAPDGFVISNEVKFTVTSDKETQKVVMIDKILEVIKTDLVTGEELEEAELEVIDKKTGEIIDKWISNKEAHKVIGLEENKTYILKETTCPYGFEQAEEIEFTVSENKETQRVEMKDMPILQDIKLVKIDSNTKEVIKDKFTFGIYEDSECTKLIKEVKSDKENGTVLFEDLRYGIYYIKEIAAPKGYVLSDKVIKVEMNDKGIFIDNEKVESEDSTYTFEFENVPVDTPKTGDNSNLKLYAGLLGLSILALASVGVHEYKKRKSVNKK